MKLNETQMQILTKLFENIDEEGGTSLLLSIDNSLNIGVITNCPQKAAEQGLIYLSTAMLSYVQEESGIASDNAELRVVCQESRNTWRNFLSEALESSDNMMDLEYKAAGLPGNPLKA